MLKLNDVTIVSGGCHMLFIYDVKSDPTVVYTCVCQKIFLFFESPVNCKVDIVSHTCFVIVYERVYLVIKLLIY